MSKFQEIVEGWKNWIMSDPASEPLAQERLKICLECKYRNEVLMTCKVCKCFIPAACKSKNKKCIKGKW